MKITSISVQARNKDRVNILVDGRYRFSLDIFQVSDLGIKTDNEYSEDELNQLEQESKFGKLYARALEYCLMRPHSAKEVRDYLYRKTRPTRSKTGEMRAGVSPETTTRVYESLVRKAYINDLSFARYWVENRSLTKGVSRRKLVAELRSKGVEVAIIDEVMGESERSDEQELRKVIAKKRSKYSDNQKFMAYLARQGFTYDDIKSALSED